MVRKKAPEDMSTVFIKRRPFHGSFTRSQSTSCASISGEHVKANGVIHLQFGPDAAKAGAARFRSSPMTRSRTPAGSHSGLSDGFQSLHTEYDPVPHAEIRQTATNPSLEAGKVIGSCPPAGGSKGNGMTERKDGQRDYRTHAHWLNSSLSNLDFFVYITGKSEVPNTNNMIARHEESPE